MAALFALVGLSYLLGSIPAGYLAGSIAGIDIRRCGSGNVGATNVLRTLGKKYGYPVFLFDFAKGLIAVKLATWMFDKYPLPGSRELCAIIGGVSAVLGHVYPLWLGFKGGKGVATAGGVIFGLMPVVALIIGLVWLIFFQLTRFVSLASVAAAIAMPLAVGVIWWSGRLNTPVLFYFSLALAALVIVRHRSNFLRLMSGTEQPFEKK